MEAYIYDTIRTARGKGNKKGSLNTITPTHLAALCLKELRDKNNLDPKAVDDVILGCVTQVMDQGANIAKTAAQQSGYGDHLCGVTLNRFCGSGLESINQAAAYVKSGFSELLIAGGVESMSRVKMGSDGGALMLDPSVAIPGHIIPQGVSADLIASKYGYSRADLDAFAVESHRRAVEANSEGRFKSRINVTDINGITVLDKDENVRPGTSVESLSGLQPSFQMMGEMAGNSSAIVDGSSVALIGNEAVGSKIGMKPRAKIVSLAVQGTDPTIMLTGIGPATMKALGKVGMKPSDIDLFEVNEAFAAVVLRAMDHIGIDHSIVNVNGGAIAMGHPLGATGTMLVGTLLDELERRDLSTGCITLCIGGGMGIATIIERV
ncbi:UNVERIFIED_CONTAM: hypothetical protein GTU68_054503 [Idotea baltica]|nr:hypothetical protein [Idotea baltica]